MIITERVITINIESHNYGDSYYTMYIPRQYITSLNNYEIDYILNTMKYTYFENTDCDCSNTWDIDIKDLDEKLSKLGLKVLESDKTFCVNLDEEHK